MEVAREWDEEMDLEVHKMVDGIVDVEVDKKVDVEVDGKEIGRAGVEAWEVAGGSGGRPRLPSTWDRWGLT